MSPTRSSRASWVTWSSRAASSFRTTRSASPIWTSRNLPPLADVGAPVSRAPITVASYNMRKAIGLDRRRDPHRVLSVLREIDADVIALQEADKRIGGRGSTVPHELIDSHGMYKPVHLGVRHRRMLDKARKHTDRILKVNTRNIGWHGNAILVKRHVGVLDCAALDLPTLEPRGAVIAELLINDKPLRVVGMHLDLSGLWRKRQMRAIIEAIGRRPQRMPTVLMGDTNEWRTEAGCLKELNGDFHLA